MKKLLLYFWMICLIPAAAFPGADDYWQQFVHYTMDVTLEPETHMLTGTSSILYRNTSPDTLDKIYMHLYPNGYRNPQSLRAREARRFYQAVNTDPEAAGWIEITEFRILPVSERGGPEKPMSAFHVDDTILEAALPQPLPPGEEVRIELAFKSKVRRHQGRAGYRGKQYDFAQWYPKMCVYDENGWNNVPFHMLGEFYGEFGTFDVTINVPFAYIVAATGSVTAGDPGWSLVEVDTSMQGEAWQEHFRAMKDTVKALGQKTPTRTVTFHAENVHDFAWVACPDFLYERGEWDGIPIHVVYRSWAKDRWSKKVTERGRRALEWLSSKFGRYPYPQLTIAHGLLGGGMEYPMLVMNASESEGLILHEVGHIYFYGILGNNEQKEAFLDEGFTSFQTRWYMETRYGKWGYNREARLKDASWLERHRPELTSRQSNRNWALMYMNSGHNEPISKWAYQYNDGLGYTVNAYTKGAIFYEMLRYVVGPEKFEKICREYFSRWKFKHVNESRFKAVCEEVSGMELDWFFDEWLHGTPTVDYTLGRVKKQKQSDGSYRTEVEVVRKGDGIMPVEVAVTLPDGSTQIQRWDGKGEKGVLVFATPAKPQKVALDPNDEIMDTQRLGHGTMRLEVYPAYPRTNYSPPDAYVITYKHAGWYDDVSGIRPGLRLRGAYRNSRYLNIGLYYGTRSRTVDGYVRYIPNPTFGDGISYSLYAGRQEGRIFGDAHINFSRSKFLFQPPRHQLSLGFWFSKLDEPRFAFTQYDLGDEIVTLPNWAPGKVSMVYATFFVNPRGIKWRSEIRMGLRAGNEGLGGDYNFHRITGEVKFWLPGRRVSVHARAYAGAFFGDKNKLPIQHLFPANGADGFRQFQAGPLTRSRGAFPAEAHYHVPGGGNLRGYFERPDLVGDAVMAANLEIRKPLRFRALDKIFITKLLGRPEIVLFADAGSLSLLSETRATLADAGIGLFFQKRLPDAWYTFFTGSDYQIRIDFPIWVHQPDTVSTFSTGQDAFDFRYVLSFERAF